MLGLKSKQVKKAEKCFILVGYVGYYADYGNDGDNTQLYGEELNEKIETTSQEKAIQIAKDKIEAFLEKNKEYMPPSGPEDWPEERTFRFTLTQQDFWELNYIKEKPEEAPQPKKTRHIPAHVVETCA